MRSPMSNTVDEEAIPDLPGLTPDCYARWRASTVGAITERLERRLVLELVCDVRGRRVLNVGCGDGDLAIDLSKRGARVVGIDSSSAMINAAKQHAERNPTNRPIRCSETPSICPKGADVGQLGRSSADGEGRAQSIVDCGLQD
jgi:ribosomal protein L11 methylase PrmA